MNLGNPDLFGYAYSDDAFRNLIQPHRGSYEIWVVITSVPIEDNFYDVERAILTGEILERQRDCDTGESKYRIRGNH
jgi:hypothetical protein